jgi:hypothetical protein
MAASAMPALVLRDAMLRMAPQDEGSGKLPKPKDSQSLTQDEGSEKDSPALARE